MSSGKKQIVPAIRFKGYADDWEQRRLGEITESFSGGTPSVANHSYYGGSIPFIRSAEINSKNTELYLTEEGLNSSSAKLVEEGDILYALYGATSGEVGISQINGAINQAILAIKPKSEYDSIFIMQWLRRQKNSIISTYLQGGQGNLSGAIVKDLILSAPIEYDEQIRIGSFFKQLDDTIALHQRQLDNYKELKKVMRQKILNRELRFKDENGNNYPEWRKTLLKKVAKIYDGTHQTPNYQNSGIKFVSVENIKKLEGTKKYISEEDYKKDFKVVPEYGDILMTRIGDVGTSTVVETYEPLAYYVSLALIKCKNINSGYLNHYIGGEQFQNELWKKVLHVAFPKKINKGDIGECMIICPSVEEQQKIADFLSAIDKQLQKVEQTVELLKEQKKGFMQQMFI